MTTPNWHFDAPWLQHTQGHPEAALGAAMWLWMHDVRHRKEALQDLEHRLLAPIEAGQYVIARHAPPSTAPPHSPSLPVALLLFARFDELAESRYLAAPLQKIAIRDWQSGDHLWLIDWTAPFGHTSDLRKPLLDLLAGSGARSLRRPERGATGGAQLRWWQQRSLDKGNRVQTGAGDVQAARKAPESRQLTWMV